MKYAGLVGHTTDTLQFIADKKALKDDALALRIQELSGEPCDRTTIVHYRSGTRAMPFPVWPVALGLLDEQPRVDTLNRFVGVWGLRVVPEGDVHTDERGLGDRALEIGDLAGDTARTVRQALADGKVTDSERTSIREAAAKLRAAAAALEAVAGGGR